jgi:exopolysaccharide biosynthesis predicted pyruvyltransferase EpsI
MKVRTAVLINDTSKEEYHIGCVTVINNIRQLCHSHNIKLIKTYSRNELLTGKFSDIKKTLQDQEIIIVNGEGSLHHHPRTNTKWLLKLLNIMPHNKKMVLINTLWQDMEKLVDYDKQLDKFNFISVRETLSYNSLLSMYPKPEKLIITPDLIFATEIPNFAEGYGDSVIHDIRNQLKEYDNYFPLSFISRGSYFNPKELTIPSLQGYLKWLKSLEFHVTGRFHGVCLSSLMNIPFLAFPSNSHKIEGILGDMYCSNLLITSLDDIENKKPLAKELIVKAHNYAIEARPKIDELFRRISQL